MEAQEIKSCESRVLAIPKRVWGWKYIWGALILLLLVLAQLSCSPSNEPARQLAKEAFESFRKIESQIEVGISLYDCQKALGEAHHALKKFLDDPGAKTMPKFTKAISLAENDLEFALVLWKLDINGLKELGYYNYGEERIDSLLESYPFLKPISKCDRSFKAPNGTIHKISPLIPIKDACSATINQFSKELKQAKQYLDRGE